MNAYVFLSLFVIALLILPWRLLVTPRLATAKERRWRAQWPTNDLEQLLVEATDDPAAEGKFVAQFEQSLVYSPHAAGNPVMPLIISAQFDKASASDFGVIDAADNGVMLGPWVLCFTSWKRIEDIRRDPLLSHLLSGGIAEFSAKQILQQAGANAACVLINPKSAFRRKLEPGKIDHISH